MTTGTRLPAAALRRRWIAAIAAVAGVAILAVTYLVAGERSYPAGPTVGEKLSDLDARRAALQARADGEARIELVAAFRIAGLLSDALAVRHADERERTFDTLPALQRQVFADAAALDRALEEALDRLGEGARAAARAAARPAQATLDRLAGDGSPLVLQYSPRFVPPRRTAGELRLAPHAAAPVTVGTVLPLGGGGTSAPDRTQAPVIPRYAPAFAAGPADDPPVEVEVAAVGFDEGGPTPVLRIGSWRGEARVTPLRLHFIVPRSAFATDAARSTFVSGTLAVRHGSRIDTFELLFVVLPDHPGSFAFDQKVETTVPEADTLVSPEILARAAVGETKVVRRCFDPPPGSHFDKSNRRVVEVDRLGWLDDMSDPTLNDGSVAFAANEKPQQICVVVTARPTSKTARTATIGRFEATLVRDRPDEKAVKSGVRALDWQEPVSVPLDPTAVEWKLYIRLFGEIDRELDNSPARAAKLPKELPFLHVDRDKDGKNLILRADPRAEP
jgi:hypothetical protein